MFTFFIIYKNLNINILYGHFFRTNPGSGFVLLLGNTPDP